TLSWCASLRLYGSMFALPDALPIFRLPSRKPLVLGEAIEELGSLLTGEEVLPHHVGLTIHRGPIASEQAHAYGPLPGLLAPVARSEVHTSELQSRFDRLCPRRLGHI